MKYVIIVNGKPESGKTTFERECRYYLNDIECAQCHVISTIDPIKDIYRKLGWDGKKTDKARKELSALKKMWIDNCNGPLKYAVEYILKADNKEDHVIFIDIREESEIIALYETLSALQAIGIECHKMLIERSDNMGLEYGNKSDDMVGTLCDKVGTLYDIGIDNSGTLEDLRRAAHEFINDLFGIETNMEDY